jgi:hypothetical protein
VSLIAAMNFLLLNEIKQQKKLSLTFIEVPDGQHLDQRATPLYNIHHIEHDLLVIGNDQMNRLT